jgi:hypothetical protein
MVDPLVEQLRFTRSEWQRGLQEISAEEAAQRFESINSIAWMVGHLAWQEQAYWLDRAQGKIIAQNVLQCGFGQAVCNPALVDMWESWHTITQAADPYLDTLTTEKLQEYYIINGKAHRESIGTMLLRMIYHYWYHLGESQAVRQMLGHSNLPGFVGNMKDVAYRPASER